MRTEILPVACLKDNYAYLIWNPISQEAIVIDPSEFQPVDAWISRKGARLVAVLNTHHHWDHVGGNVELSEKYGCPVVVPRGDFERIPGATRRCSAEEVIAGLRLSVIDVPGHTANHVAFYFPDLQSVFTGDTLFVLGCGRLFEGTAAQMTQSLSAIAALPEDTLIYCGHEYFESNYRFAHSALGDLEALTSRKQQFDAAQSPCSVPSTLALERATNPFLLSLDGNARKRFGWKSDAQHAFATLRSAKDEF